MMKNVKNLVGAAVVSMVLGCAAPAMAQAVQASEWMTNTYLDSDELYLYTQTDGNVLTMDGQVVSNEATLKMLVSDGGVTFRVMDRDGKDLYSAEAQNAEFIYSLAATGIPEVTGTLTNNGDSIYWNVTGEAEIPGISGMNNDRLLINELIQDGVVTLWFKCPYWNGEADRVLCFEISSADSQFACQYKSAVDAEWINTEAAGTASQQNSPAASQQSTYYSNDDIVTICDNYVYSFNNVVPYANSLYASIQSMDEHPILGFLGGAFSLGTSVEPIEIFIEAKSAFDHLDPSKMTPDQSTYYYTTQQNVDSTELGVIIQVISFLGESGLLD